MVSKSLRLVLLVLALGLPALTQAKTFSNSYIEFSLPDRWDCVTHSKAYICRHEVSQACQRRPEIKTCQEQIQKSREAFIIFAAKEASEIDSLENYTSMLREPKELKINNNATQSEVVHAKVVKVKNLSWVDGMHLGSELPKYYTRYLATIKGQVAVLVTFNAHKLYYTNYSTAFFDSIKTMNVKASELSQVRDDELGNKVLSRPLDLPADLLAQIDSGGEQQAQSEDGISTLLFLLALILGVVGVFIWWRGRKPL